MQSIEAEHATDYRLRFVFHEKVVSFPLAADATFGEIARALGWFARRRYGQPIAIDVTLGRSPAKLRGR